MLAYLALKWLHIVAAGLVLGLLAIYPLLPGRLPKDAAQRLVARHTLRFLDLSSNALLLPAVVLLFLTGVPMSVGPVAEQEMLAEEGQWIVVGMFLWTLVAATVAGLMFGVVKQMLALAERDELQGARMKRLWNQFRWGYLAGLAVTLLTFWVMVFQPVFF